MQRTTGWFYVADDIQWLLEWRETVLPLLADWSNDIIFLAVVSSAKGIETMAVSEIAKDANSVPPGGIFPPKLFVGYRVVYVEWNGMSDPGPRIESATVRKEDLATTLLTARRLVEQAGIGTQDEFELLGSNAIWRFFCGEIDPSSGFKKASRMYGAEAINPGENTSVRRVWRTCLKLVRDE